MKKIAFVVSILIIASIALVGCSSASSYHGEYTSSFIDVQNVERDNTFSLSIKKDKTFVLIKKSGEEVIFTREGVWKSATSDNQVSLICLINPIGWNENLPGIISEYFALSFLDDGSLMAVPSMIGNPNYLSSAFGYGDASIRVSMVHFNKI